MEIIHHSHSIFFSSDKNEKDWAQGLLNAKLELIANIFKIRSAVGFVPSGEDFDILFDLDVDELHQEVIKSEDWVAYIRSKRKIS